MKEAFKSLRRKQWRALLKDNKTNTSDLGEFKAKIGDEIIRGFTKHKPNGRMKVFEDTNGDGGFSKSDQLIARGRVKKDFWRTDNPLDAFEVGKVEMRLEREPSKDGFPPGIGAIPVLDFKNSDGDMVTSLGLIQQGFPIWEGCPGCF